MTLDEQDKQWITDTLEAMETRLLRGFEGWVSQITQESKNQAKRQREFEERLDLMDTRLTELEKWKRAKP